MSSSRERPGVPFRPVGSPPATGGTPARPAPAASRVLTGAAAAMASPARMDADLRRSRFVRGATADPRLVDPRLEQAFEEEAARVREAARAEGYAAGWAEGHAAASAGVRAEAAATEAARVRAEAERTTAVTGALHAFARAADALERRAVAPAAELRDAVLEGALQLTTTLLDRELSVAAEPGLDAIRRALDLVPSSRPVLVRLHPADHAALPATGPLVVAGREITCVPDPAVEPGGCLAECDATQVDAQLGTALARVHEVLAR